MPMTKSTQGRKQKAATLTFISSTTKRCQSICKNLDVFQCMGTDTPSEFSHLDKHMLSNGILQFDIEVRLLNTFVTPSPVQQAVSACHKILSSLSAQEKFAMFLKLYQVFLGVELL